MRFELMHPADQLVLIISRIYQYGMTTMSGGNLSIRDENGDIWITPSGIDKGNLRRADMCQVKPDGTVIGPHRPSVELPFHKEIYRRRPDLKAILHAHPPTLVAFSLARKLPNTALIPNASEVCGRVTYAKYEVPGSAKLGEYIADEFEKGFNTVMMENHGVVIGHKDLFSAFMAFETLDFCGRLEIDAAKLGKARTLTEEQIDIDRSITSPNLDEYIPGSISSEECAGRRDLCELIHRSYDQRLFTSTQGTFAMRLSDGSFLTTPYNKDRKYLEPEDIVHIKHGMREMGKRPSRAARLLEEIFKTHEDVNAVIIAHPPAIMSFAVTDADFDSRLIPESYISLRDVVRVPYAASRLDIEGTARIFDKKHPVVIVNNQCVIVTGASLLNAYDRLEVLEYSAAAMIAAKDIGEVVYITDDEVKAIEKAFNLED
ncbi:MAG: class II aldolase/adducin family protein [Clostridia bacterium]|nr:class II aldolase/adducin family protein [Clostridia bacterium]